MYLKKRMNFYWYKFGSDIASLDGLKREEEFPDYF